MGLIREPLHVDFEVDPRPLTKEEKSLISEYIKSYKAKHSRKSKGKIGDKKKSGRKKISN